MGLRVDAKYEREPQMQTHWSFLIVTSDPHYGLDSEQGLDGKHKNVPCQSSCCHTPERKSSRTRKLAASMLGRGQEEAGSTN